MRTIHDPGHRFNGKPRERRSTERIVIHHTAGNKTDTAAIIHGWHLARKDANGVHWIGIGYNFVIRYDGTIERGRPEWASGAHCVGHNNTSIGICLAGNFEQYAPSAAQMDSLVWLIGYLRGKYGDIPVSGHGDLAATACPGRHFPWGDLKQRLQGGTPAPAPAPAPGVNVRINGRNVTAPLRIIDGRTQVQLSGHWVLLVDLVAAIPDAYIPDGVAGWDPTTKTVNVVVP